MMQWRLYQSLKYMFVLTHSDPSTAIAVPVSQPLRPEYGYSRTYVYFQTACSYLALGLPIPKRSIPIERKRDLTEFS